MEEFGLRSLSRLTKVSFDAIRSELATIKAQTDKPFNVNFFCHEPPTPDAAREATWRAALSPYYQEYGIDSATIPTGAGRTTL